MAKKIPKFKNVEGKLERKITSEFFFLSNEFDNYDLKQNLLDTFMDEIDFTGRGFMIETLRLINKKNN